MRGLPQRGCVTESAGTLLTEARPPTGGWTGSEPRRGVAGAVGDMLSLRVRSASRISGAASSHTCGFMLVCQHQTGISSGETS